mgnify:CR=1 FL=1
MMIRLRPEPTCAVLVAACAAAWMLDVSRVPAASAADALAGTELLSRPTDHSVVVHAIAARGLTVVADYGTGSQRYDQTTAPVHVAAGDPVELAISGLAPDTSYVYRLRVTPDDSGTTLPGAEHAFHTQRAAGSPFTFVVQADPHLDENSSPEVYGQALRNELADHPDFLVDLGDASMVDKCVVAGDVTCKLQRAANYEQVAARNALLRSSVAQVGHSLPLLMVLGNHEGEAGWNETGTAANLSLWDLRARKFFFANPEPDGFYSGNTEVNPFVGLRQDYYAFEWGDALFVMLDPFTYTSRKPTQYTDADMWGWTLGADQYHWLERTLTTSRARYRFVFSHHMVGGAGPEARSGAASAAGFEWGGHNIDGSWGFDTRRPGWSKPIHQLLVEHGVTAWFHGHDHVYVQETLDGVVYQEVPQPSTARYDSPDLAAQYGYQGKVGVNAFPSPGHLRVEVGPTGVRVSYVRAVAPADQTATRRNAEVVTSYEVR